MRSQVVGRRLLFFMACIALSYCSSPAKRNPAPADQGACIVVSVLGETPGLQPSYSRVNGQDCPILYFGPHNAGSIISLIAAARYPSHFDLVFCSTMKYYIGPDDPPLPPEVCPFLIDLEQLLNSPTKSIWGRLLTDISDTDSQNDMEMGKRIMELERTLKQDSTTLDVGQLQFAWLLLANLYYHTDRTDEAMKIWRAVASDKAADERSRFAAIFRMWDYYGLYKQDPLSVDFRTFLG